MRINIKLLTCAILSLLSFYANAHGDYFKSTRTEIISSSEEQLKELRKSLIEINPSANTEIYVKRTLSGKYKLKVSELVPQPFKEILMRSQRNGEANCYNGALVFNKIIPALRFSSPVEFGFYMNSKLCRKLNFDEKNITGDIIEFLGGHASVYITDDVLFNKVSNDRTPWKFEKMSRAWREFKEYKKCESSDQSDVCGMVEIYRCRDLKNLQVLSADYSELADIDMKLSKVEKAYELNTLTRGRTRHSLLRAWKSDIQLIKDELDNLNEFSWKNEKIEKLFYFNSLHERYRMTRNALDNHFGF